MTELENSERRLADARRRGDPDGLAEALVKHADVLVRHFRFGAARDVLDEASAIHRERGRAFDEARCARCRRVNLPPGGAARRGRGADRPGRASRPARERPGARRGGRARRDRAGSPRCPGRGRGVHPCLDAATAPPLPPRARAGLLRKRATALVAEGRHADAASDLDAAHDLFAQAGDPAEALRAASSRRPRCKRAATPRRRNG